MSLVLETSKYFFARSCWSFLLYSRTTCNVEVKSRIVAYCTDQFSSVKSCFLKWLTSSRGRKTHNQHRDILLCMFNFVNSGLNSFTWLYKGMPGVKCLESFGFFVLVNRIRSLRTGTSLHFQHPDGRMPECPRMGLQTHCAVFEAETLGDWHDGCFLMPRETP